MVFVLSLVRVTYYTPLFTCTSVGWSSCLSHTVTHLALASLLKPLQLVHLD